MQIINDPGDQFRTFLSYGILDFVNHKAQILPYTPENLYVRLKTQGTAAINFVHANVFSIDGHFRISDGFGAVEAGKVPLRLGWYHLGKRYLFNDFDGDGTYECVLAFYDPVLDKLYFSGTNGKISSFQNSSQNADLALNPI